MTVLPDYMAEQMSAAGFVERRGTWSRNGHTAALKRGWLSVESRAQPVGAARRDLLGEPGLWRRRNGHAVFELPMAMLRLDVDDDADEGDIDERMTLAAALKWAADTAAPDADRAAAPPWQAPQRDLVLEWLEGASLTVQIGGVVRECVIDRGDDALSLRCPLLPSLPAELPAPRMAWLQDLVNEMQQRWRLVRVGMDADARAVIAEVNVTGAPQALLPKLIPVAADSLRWVVGWAAPSAAVIVDTNVACDVLAAAPC